MSASAKRKELEETFVKILFSSAHLFQIYVSLYQNIIYTAGKSFSVVMWP